MKKVYKMQKSCHTPVLGLVSGAVIGYSLSYASSWPFICLLLALFVGLLQTVESRSRRLAVVWLFSVGFLVGALYWLGLGIYHPPVNTALSAVLLTTGLIGLHASVYAGTFAGVECVVQRLTGKGGASVVFSLAAAWSAAEVLRSIGLWAMPWGLLGYSQLDNPVLSGLYPLIGAHGVAGFTWLLAGGTWLLASRARRVWGRRSVAKEPVHRHARGTSWYAAVFVVVGLVVTSATDLLSWTEPAPQGIDVRLVHTDLVGDEKQAVDAQRSALEKLQLFAAASGADLTVFPELFILRPAAEISPDVRRQVVDAVKRSHTSLLFGTLTQAPTIQNPDARQNTLIQIAEDGDTRVYAKEILLPFSEFLPKQVALSWAYALLYRYPQADFDAGAPQQSTLQVRGVPLGLTICSELAYAGKASRQARNAQLLINASSDSWIPSSAYFRQAQLIARVRAAEARKPMVRANNVGYSAFIDERGHLSASFIGGSGVGYMRMVPRMGTTPYVRFAAWLSQAMM